MTTDYFINRRTVRRYDGRVVADDLIRTIAEEASHAPTTGNMQLYSVVVTRDPERRKELTTMHFNQPASTSANVLLTFCADFNRFVKWCEASDAVPGYGNFQSFVSALLDTTIFAQQFCTIAELRGLGCCYLGTTTYNAPQIARFLELPDLVVPVTTLSLGYPEGDAPESDRIGVDAIIHHERYQDYSVEDVIKIYAEKEAREDSRGFVAENGKKTLAQVFTDVRYPRNNNELFSKIYKDFIESKGFSFAD